ncbi:hypothetical protein V6C03_00490 [Methyloligella sp. 2.7D]|uniref:hypothetical protein n=1 Tax=unclassified Methyloligella TaxID=2625955 RepID=UPI00157CC530|nr:hypothetical protein [Methyloligella sp. GL2]QKP76850.1 hypothetical protein HT051_04925 [Methyloligella sp. GL2]
MSSFGRALVVALLFAGAGVGLSAPAAARCVGVSGTADGFDKQTAVTRAQAAVVESVNDIKAKYRVRSVSLAPRKMKPQPYWRSEVPADVYVKPDIITRSTHTVCWHGVVSPYVCTSGARVCF